VYIFEKIKNHTMNEIIENTSNIISKITSSRQGYILQLSDKGYEVLHIWGATKEDFVSLNDLFAQLVDVGGIDTENIVKLPTVSSVIKERFSSSFLMKDLTYISERNLFIYIVLFSDNADAFNDVSKSKLMPILSILSHQVKDWLEEQVDKSASKSDQQGLSSKTTSGSWKKKFNILLSTSPDLIFVLDHSGRIISINEASKSYLDYLPEEMKGKKILDFINKEDISELNSSFNRALADKKTVKFKANFLTKYGHVTPLELSCTSITENGKIIGLLGVGKDLSESIGYETELQKLKPKLIELNRLLKIERSRTIRQKSVIEELNRLKYEFISGISHEFRTTLASIIGFAETISSDPEVTESMKKEFIKVILSEGKRLAKLINYFLDASNSDSNVVIMSKTKINLVNLTKEVISANVELASSKNIDLNFEYPKDEINIEADKESLFQVINALVNNAIRYTEELGRVKLIINNYNSEVEIIVSDTGIGIPDEDQPYIFQRFFKVSRGMSDIPSVGVGLVFVKQIIDLHKGLISVQSESGSGTTFLVKLPKRSKIETNEVNIE
jgi:PAS domain S-box-containing protein